MKNAILTCAAALSLAAAVGEPLVAKKPDGSGDAKQPSVLQRVGGFVIDWSAAKGKYLFVNCQDQHDMGLVRALAGRMSEDYSWVFECPDGDKNVSSIAQAVAEKARLGALAATVFVSSADLPLMTVAPESNLAVVNVRALVADKPSKILSDNRLVREALRAFAFSLGTGYTSLDAGVMQPVSSAADLDRFSATFMPADSAKGRFAMNAMQSVPTNEAIQVARRTAVLSMPAAESMLGFTASI